MGKGKDLRDVKRVQMRAVADQRIIEHERETNLG